MHNLAISSKFTLCPHQIEKQRSGIALVTIGNPLRKDDGIASLVADGLSVNVKEELCRYDLESYSQFLTDCLAFHQIAVIMDATGELGKVGEVTILNLTDVVDSTQRVDLKSGHGLSFVDELKIGSKENMPDEVYFFGIEVGDTDWGKGLSRDLEKKREILTAQLEDFLKSIFIKNGL